MDNPISSDTLNRSVKLAIDSGQADTFAEAQSLFESYNLAIRTGPDIACSPSLQAALLTAVNTARRCFIGGVKVMGAVDVPLEVAWRQCTTLREAITDLQGTIVDSVSPQTPLVVIGDSKSQNRHSDFAIRTTLNGWSGGVLPLDVSYGLPNRQEFVPAGVLAGALAVSEAFQYIRGDNVLAGRRDLGLSLWNPAANEHWLEADPGPILKYLPAKLWVIGLGHLGQAFLWTLGLLPYASPSEVELVLQDFDTLVLANDSTSLLTHPDILGMKKTRAMAVWCEERGFRTTIHERKFATNFNINDEEPQVALCGVDNALARASLGEVGFKRILEAGLGQGVEEYLTFQAHTFPSSKSPRDLWGRRFGAESTSHDLIRQRAYQTLASKGCDECGLTNLADRTVGASFVGAIASTFIIAELLRMIVGAQSYEVVDADLRTSAFAKAIAIQSLEEFNPGITDALQVST